MKLLRRYLGSMTFEENGQTTMKLPRNYCYSALQFVLVAQIDRTDQGQAGTCKDSAPAQLVKRVEVILNGKNVVKNLDYETMHRLNQMRHGVRPYIYAHDLLGYAQITNGVFKVAAQLDFELPKQGPWRTNVDTLLDSRGLSSLDLQVTFGSAQDIMDDTYDDADGITVDSAKLYVYSVERVGAPVTAYALWKEYRLIQHTIAGAGDISLDVPVNTTYNQIVVKTHADGDQVDTILPFGLANLNTIEVYSGTEKFLRLPAGLLQTCNRTENQIEVPERVGSGAALNHAQQELLLEGYYDIDFCHDGRLTEMLDATKLSDLKLDLQVAAPGTDNKVDVYCSEIILPAVQTNGQAA